MPREFNLNSHMIYIYTIPAGYYFQAFKIVNGCLIFEKDGMTSKPTIDKLSDLT